MRHHVSGNQLGRRHNQAKALYRSLLEAIISRGKIETTVPKAKAVQGELDKLLTIAKNDNPNNRRLAVKILGTERLLNRLFREVSPAFGDITSGFSRIIKLGKRYSDTAEMAIFELTRLPVQKVVEIVEEKKKPETKTEVVEGEVVKEKKPEPVEEKKTEKKKTVSKRKVEKNA